VKARCRVGRRLNLLVGPRFEHEVATAKMRAGDGYTLVVDVEPISGPVFRVEDEGEFAARCDGCNEHSRFYRRRGEPALRRWAHEHRCVP
jgi:hypothetical protein